MKKTLALVLVLVIALSALSVSAFADTTYVGNSVYCEAGYENDVYNGVAKVLTLKDDGTFFLVDNTSIIHNSYSVVTNWFYFVTGTYEVTDDDEGTLTVVLTGTEVTYVMNGSVTTENGYAGELHWTDGRLRTSKDDKQNHGFGILSIERIIHKYGGRYSIRTEDQIFTMNIVFPVGADGQR